MSEKKQTSQDKKALGFINYFINKIATAVKNEKKPAPKKKSAGK
jgi:hypothetical protein